MQLKLIQFDIKKGDTLQNLSHIDELLSTSEGSGLIVLPEMFHCGFTAETGNSAELNGGRTLAWMLQTAKQRNSYICGSAAVKIDDKIFNRMYMVSPSGQVEYYDKRHLFSMGMETQTFSAGSERKIVNVNGWRCLLQVCYDVRFPVFSRNAGKIYDMAIYVANWPAPRADVWLTLLKARAIENQCYVVGVNRTGECEGINYKGQSIIYGPRGEIVAQADGADEQIIEAEVNLEAMQHFRQKFPVLRDADAYKIE